MGRLNGSERLVVVEMILLRHLLLIKAAIFLSLVISVLSLLAMIWSRMNLALICLSVRSHLTVINRGFVPLVQRMMIQHRRLPWQTTVLSISRRRRTVRSAVSRITDTPMSPFMLSPMMAVAYGTSRQVPR